MADFAGHRCWSPAGAADLPTEAVIASPGYFFATHAPLKIRRSTPDDIRGTAGVEVNEEMVCDDFLTRPTAGGALLMPVIGESGTGKSHLVRWVKERTESTATRQVIYLPKNETSLKAVVTKLLAEVRSAELDQLRDDVERTTSELDQQGLEQRLLNYLAEALVSAPKEAGPAAALVGKNGLATLLYDNQIRTHLLREGALIPKLAESLLRDRKEGEKDRTAEFTIDDLPLDVGNALDAGNHARRMLTFLGASPERQLIAVKLLNEYVSAAVTNATNIGAGRLTNAMLQIRRAFKQQGKEIVLLIEDFAVIQGFQRDLLDAIIEVGERDGKSDLAPIRTLMAVTTGYYARLTDTVMTRTRQVPYVYNLDIQFDPKNMMGEAASFVGRYLNAARVGRAVLDESRPGDDIHNACDDCDLRVRCHGAFGHSAEGHGLYPFNESALRRAIRARRAPGSDPGAFNPRIVIGEVVRNVLREHAQAIKDGIFPDRRFTEDYPRPAEEAALPTTMRRVLEDQLGEDDLNRYATFLEFWGDARTSLADLPPDMRDAFAIEVLDGAETGVDEKPGDTGNAGGTQDDEITPSPSPKSTDTPRSLAYAIDHVENWAARGEQLPLGTANIIRRVIRNAVVERCAWNDPLMPEPNTEILKKAWPVGSATVFIDGAYGQNEASDAPIKFPRSARHSMYFRGLLLADAGVLEGRPWATSEHVASAVEALRRLARDAELYQGSLQQAVLQLETSGGSRRGALTDDQLALGVRASLIGATLAGKALPEMGEDELLAIVFDEGRDWHRGDATTCSAEWTNTLTRHLKARPELVWHLRAGFGISRGVTGKVRMLDATRVLPMLREAIASWQWQTPNSALEPWVRSVVEGFTGWDDLLNARISHLASERDRIRSLLPQGTSLTETVDAVRAAIENAAKVGVGEDDHGQSARIRDLAERAKQCDGRAIDRLERELAATVDEDSTSRQAKARIAAAARDRGAEIVGIGEFLTESDHWLTTALDAAKMRPRGAGTAADTAVRDLLVQWAAIDEKEQG